MVLEMEVGHVLCSLSPDRAPRWSVPLIEFAHALDPDA